MIKQFSLCIGGGRTISSISKDYQLEENRGKTKNKMSLKKARNEVETVIYDEFMELKNRKSEG